MPISEFLSNKWDERLYNWLLWLNPEGFGGGDVSMSSIYRPELTQRGTERTSGRNAVLSGPAMDTDKLMVRIQAKDVRMYEALKQWTANDGTRAQQAARVPIHHDAYKDIVDSGKRVLERMEREKATAAIRQSKSTRLYPERV